MYANYSDTLDWSNVTVISDGYLGVYWNDGGSLQPSIAVDDNNNIHVVWKDQSDGVWTGGEFDYEIMYTNFTIGVGWSNATVISDGYMGEYWNDDDSQNPEIAVDNNNNLHVVWDDSTVGKWSADPYESEIMYVNFTAGEGWTNATIISDGYMGEYWNDGASLQPSIAVDYNNNIHAVWKDGSEGVWTEYFEPEIMYVNYTVGDGWSNVSVISDGYMGEYWNDDCSYDPSIAIDNNGILHVVWEEYTEGAWGGGEYDSEIMYTNLSFSLTPDSFKLSSTAGSPESDGFFNLNWKKSYQAHNYSVYESNSSISEINSNVSRIAEGLTNNSKSISGYTSGTYYFIIEAINEFGSTLSNCIMVEVEIPLLVPGSLTLSSTASTPDIDGNFELNWTDSDRAVNYSVYESTSGSIAVIDGSVKLVQQSLTDTSIKLSGYINGTYYFIIEAINEFGSTLSNCIMVEVEIPLLVPESLTLTSTADTPDSDGTFALNWTESIERLIILFISILNILVRLMEV